MNCIGIRVTPKIIYFSILNVENKKYSISTTEKITVPVSMDVPDQLSFIRTTLFSVIKEYHVKYAGIRRMEDNVPSKKLDPVIKRAYFEGVIQELISNCSIEKYFSGKLSKIGCLLKENIKDVKSCAEGSINIFKIDDWETYTKEERESILCALAASTL